MDLQHWIRFFYYLKCLLGLSRHSFIFFVGQDQDTSFSFALRMMIWWYGTSTLLYVVKNQFDHCKCRFAKLFRFLCSVADPGCLSRIPDPDFYPSRISDPGSRIQKQQQKTGVKIFIFFKPFFVATNFTKLNIILFLICWRKKFGPIFQELLKFLPTKLSPSPQKYGFGIWDPRSGIRKKPIPDPGSRGQKGTGSRIRIRNTVFMSKSSDPDRYESVSTGFGYGSRYRSGKMIWTGSRSFSLVRRHKDATCVI